MKSPISMRNGRFNTSKVRLGKLQKMGVLYTHSPKMPGSTSYSQKIKIKSNQKSNQIKKIGNNDAAME
jgi:hypothetical protein